MKILLQLLLVWSICPSAFSQDQEAKALYRQSFEEQRKMLNGSKSIDFKRSVFLTENSFHKGKLNYQAFCADVSNVGRQLKDMIRSKGIQGYKTAPNWAAFTYMTDSIIANNFKPFRYDFKDFMGEKDWTKMFVTKLVRTHSGNCHSLPYYYKILCEEIGGKASLALAPNHIYIKHLDEKGQWTNVELTNGGFPRDQWIIKEMAISVEAIKKGSYMAPLTDKEAIAMTMYDLANAYHFQFGKDDFFINVINTALKHYPQCIPLLQLKANYVDAKLKIEKKKASPNHEFLITNIKLYKNTLAKIHTLGYKDMPPELYKEWMKAVEKEKAKQNLSVNN